LFFILLFFFGENLYRYKNILQKSPNNIFAIPSGHGIEALFGSFVLFAPPFCEVGFSKCF
jgi:hypothetical protein